MRMTAHIGTETLTGLVIICSENGQAEKFNKEQIVEDFMVESAKRMLFREVSRATKLQRQASTTSNVVLCALWGVQTLCCSICFNMRGYSSCLFCFGVVLCICFLCKDTNN